jgi:hypothetical protein
MAYAKLYHIGRAANATLTSTPYSRGMVLNGQQVEEIVHTKLTGDTTATLTLVGITRPSAVFVEPLIDSAAAAVNTDTRVAVTFAPSATARTITVSSLGDYTRGRFIVLGRADV